MTRYRVTLVCETKMAPLELCGAITRMLARLLCFRLLRIEKTEVINGSL